MGRKNRRKKIRYRKITGYVSGYVPGISLCQTAVSNRSRRTPKRGDIWFADLGYHPGTSVQSGCRPVLIVSNDIGNCHAETFNVLPLTKHMKKPELPCHTEIDQTALSEAYQALGSSMILAEQITTIGKAQLKNYVGRVDDPDMLGQINTSISGQLGLKADIDNNAHNNYEGNEKTVITVKTEKN